MNTFAIQQQINGHRDSIRLLQAAHPRAERAVAMAEGITPPGLSPDSKRAIETIRWLEAEVSRLEQLLQEGAA